MSRKDRDLFSEFVTGAFVAGVLALLVYFTIVISGVDVLFGREKVPVTIRFSGVGGLKERDNVVFRGMKVGIVEKIALGGSNIVVTAKVDGGVTLREGYRIGVANTSLLGGNYMSMEEGTGAVLPLAETEFRGDEPDDWMRDLGRIARQLNELAGDGGVRSIVTNLEQSAANLNAIIARVARGEGTAGKLLALDDTLYRDAVAAVASAKDVAGRVARGEGMLGRLTSSNDTVYADLAATLGHAREISARLAAGKGTVGRLLAEDDAMYADLREAIANARAVSARLVAGEGSVGRLLTDGKLAQDASDLCANLKGVSERLAKGEGTLGRLLGDARMYDELDALLKDVRQVVDNYRDTTPISTFGSLVGGAL